MIDTNNDFMRQQRSAVERLREMNERSRRYTEHQNNVTAEHRANNSRKDNNYQKGNADTRQSKQLDSSKPKTEKSSGQSANNGGFDFPFLDLLKKDSDFALIAGLLLILISEKADKKLLAALIYILI